MSTTTTTTTRPPVEMAWFSALCDDDYEFLGVPDPLLRSSVEHCRNIVLTADRYGFDNVLLPSGYQLGIDNTVFAAAVAPLTTLRMLLAIRCGELVVPQLARQLATLDQAMGGRLTVNIIFERRPGRDLGQRPAVPPVDRDHVRPARAARRPRREVPWRLRRPRHRPAAGDHGLGRQPAVLLRWAVARRPRVRRRRGRRLPDVARHDGQGARREGRHGRPRGGQGPAPALRLALPRRRAGDRGRGREAARRLLSKLDDDEGTAIRQKSLDSTSAGVARQAALRGEADDEGYVERHLWTGVGRARSGAGAAIVGDPDQVAAKINELADAGIEAFILSGYPHAAECDLFARHVLPSIEHGWLDFTPDPVNPE